MISKQRRRIEKDPHCEYDAEDDDKGPGSTEGSYLVRDALTKSQPFFFFQVGIAGNLCAKKFVGSAQAASYGGKQVHGRMGMLVDELKQSVAMHDKHLRFFTGHCSGCSGATIQE